MYLLLTLTHTSRMSTTTSVTTTSCCSVALLALLLVTAQPHTSAAAAATTTPFDPLPYDAYRFERAVNDALAVTARVLGEAREPMLPARIDHSYADKFALAEAGVSAFIVSSLHALEAVGMTQATLRTVAGWAANNHSVTLRFNASTACDYAREDTHDVAAPNKETTSMGVFSISTRVTTTVTEHVWMCRAEWEVSVFRGTGRSAGDNIVLTSRRSARAELRTATKVQPAVGSSYRMTPMDLPITFLAAAVDAHGGAASVRFRIDRSVDTCRTPRRNREVDAALGFAVALYDWAAYVRAFFTQNLYAMSLATAPNTAPDVSRWTVDDLFVPALLFERGRGSNDDALHPSASPSVSAGGTPRTSSGLAELLSPPSPNATSRVLMDLSSVNTLLGEGRDGLRARADTLSRALPLPASKEFITGAEATIAVACAYARRAALHASDGVNYVEEMLRDQVVAAVGKVVTPADFDVYLRATSRRLFLPAFEPRPLVFAVRRSSIAAPEGTMRLDAPVGDDIHGGSPVEPVYAVSATLPAERFSMGFELSADSRVPFGGDVHVHAYLTHRFSAASTGFVARQPRPINLIAKARQFSSFIVLVGRISSPTSFTPVSAIIVKDNDEVAIPLALSEIPAPGDFRDAIASLSPEQAEFARAARAVQLQSTLFGVLVIQIKPHLEAVLNLPPESLTKEVELTQALMDLFIQYQIPADLLAAPREGSDESRLSAVKASVDAVRKMINKAEEREIEKRAKEDLYVDPLGDHRREPVPIPMAAAASARRGTKGFGSRTLSVSAGGRSKWGGDAVTEGVEAVTARAAQPFVSSFGGGGPVDGVYDDYESAAAVSDSGEAVLLSDSAPPPPPPEQHSSIPVSEAPTPTATTPEEASRTPPQDSSSGGAVGGGAAPLRDLTRLPGALDAQYDAHDPDRALRAAILLPAGPWTRRSRSALLARAPVISTLGEHEQASARSAAFDLLDALSRSGALSLPHASLHVIVGASHRFDKSLMDTVVQDSINPIARVELSLVLIASTLHGLPPSALVTPEALLRLAAASPSLMQVEGGGVGRVRGQQQQQQQQQSVAAVR